MRSAPVEKTIRWGVIPDISRLKPFFLFLFFSVDAICSASTVASPGTGFEPVGLGCSSESATVDPSGGWEAAAELRWAPKGIAFAESPAIDRDARYAPSARSFSWRRLRRLRAFLLCVDCLPFPGGTVAAAGFLNSVCQLYHKDVSLEMRTRKYS